MSKEKLIVAIRDHSLITVGACSLYAANAHSFWFIILICLAGVFLLAFIVATCLARKYEPRIPMPPWWRKTALGLVLVMLAVWSIGALYAVRTGQIVFVVYGTVAMGIFPIVIYVWGRRLQSKIAQPQTSTGQPSS